MAAASYIPLKTCNRIFDFHSQFDFHVFPFQFSVFKQEKIGELVGETQAKIDAGEFQVTNESEKMTLLAGEGTDLFSAQADLDKSILDFQGSSGFIQRGICVKKITADPRVKPSQVVTTAAILGTSVALPPAAANIAFGGLLFAEATPELGKAFTGTDFSTGERLKAGAVGVAEVGVGSFFGRAGFKGLARDVDIIAVQDLQKSFKLTEGSLFQGDKGSVLTLKGTGKTGTGTLESQSILGSSGQGRVSQDIIIDSFQTGGKKAIQSTFDVDILGLRTANLEGTLGAVGRAKIDPLSSLTADFKKISKGRLKADVSLTRGGESLDVPFASVSRRKDDLIGFVSGGKPTSTLFGKTKTGQVDFAGIVEGKTIRTPVKFEVIDTSTLKGFTFNPTELGLIKVKKVSTPKGGFEDLLGNVGTGGGGRGLKTIQTVDAPPIVSLKDLTKETIKPFTSTTKVSKSVTTGTVLFRGVEPSSFAGTGQFERTQEFGGLLDIKTAQTGKLVPKFDALDFGLGSKSPSSLSGLVLDIGLDSKSKTGLDSVLKSDLGSVLSIKPSQDFKLTTTQATGLKSGTAQKQGLRTAQENLFPAELVPVAPVSLGGFGTPSPRPKALFGFPIGFPGGDLFGKKPKLKKVKRKGRRTPSLVAIELGITSPSEFLGETTGLGIRPIIKKRRKKKK